MRKSLLSRGALLAGVCLLSLAVLPGIGLNSQVATPRVPGIFDWSMRHAIYPRTGPMDKMIAAQRDPRAFTIWRHQLGRRFWRHGRPGTGGGTTSSTGTHPDWSIYLGSNGTAPAMFPAKFNFDVNAAPNCPNDFVVYPVNAIGSASQSNIVAFDYLYSGTNPNGICNRAAAPSDLGTTAEVYWNYNVQGIKKGGGVSTSPAMSFDQNGTGTGTKIAFVESGNGAAHFHVLAWRARDGRSATNVESISGAIVTSVLGSGGGGSGYKVGDAGTIVQGNDSTATFQITGVATRGSRTGIVTAYTITYNGTAYTVANGVATTDSTTPGASGFTINIKTVTAPVVQITSFVTATPVIGSGTATDLPFGTSTDTLSSPFIDYQHDTAYVGNDAGQLYRFKDVFCMGINGANPDCTNANTGPAPSIDTTWGAGGFVQVCGGRLSEPIYDYGTGNVFVGCADGKLYSISQTGTITSLQVGDGSTHGGIVDGPQVDYVNGFVYAVSGSESATGGATGVLVQAKDTDLTSNVMVPIGTGGQCNLHEPVPNNAYLNGITSVGAGVYLGGVVGTVPQPCTFTSNAAGTTMELYSVGFTPTGTLVPTANAAPEGGGPGYEWSPFTEFFNATSGTDWLFVGALQNQANVASFDITNPLVATNGASAREGMGITGMVIDNDSSAAQASSFYFGSIAQNPNCNNITVTTATGGCAVKLTQANLQ